MDSSNINRDCCEPDERHHEDGYQDGDSATIIAHPKHRMVPLPVRAKSSIGRNPETSSNGYEMVTDTCPGAVVEEEQLEGVTSIIASVRLREGAESTAVARAAAALS